MKHRYILPAAWASALYYGAEALDAYHPDERQAVLAWCAQNDLSPGDLTPGEDVGFCWQHDAADLVGGAECCEYYIS